MAGRTIKTERAARTILGVCLLGGALFAGLAFSAVIDIAEARDTATVALVNAQPAP